MTVHADTAALESVVREFINERPEYIAAIIDCPLGHEDDYWRWNGGAEARRQLAERLGWTVPHNVGETTAPKPTQENRQ